MIVNEPADGPVKKTEIIAFSSGKGGTGKTLIATCLGYALTKIGLKVLMIDADIATDGLSLYLLGPDGVYKVNEFPAESTLTGILRQYREQGNFQFKPATINRSAPRDHGVEYQAIISGIQMYGDRGDSSRNEGNTQMDRDAYRLVIQPMFDLLRSKAEFDYVIVDTRGGFSDESTDVSALADSYIVVTEADVTSFYQNRNLIKYIDQAASEFDKKAVLRSIIVNKSTQFAAATNDFNLDNLESSFRLQLEREFPIDYKATHPFPLSLEALTVQKSHQIPIRHALDSDFSYAFLVAFHNILSVVTQPWTKEQVAEWNYLVESVNIAIQKRNDDLQKAEIEEQTQHRELEKLRKDNIEQVNRIASLEREIREIDERYKRELQRAEVIASKLDGDKKVAPPDAVSKAVTKPHRNLAPGIIGLSILGLLFVFLLMNFSAVVAFFGSPTTNPTIAVVLPTETPLSAAIATDTVAAGEPTQTPLPTETVAAVSTVTTTPPVCPALAEQPTRPDNAFFIADLSYPDGSVLYRGEKFEKRWFIQNTGTNTWTTDYVVAYGGLTRMDTDNPIHFPKDVPPGECLELAIPMVAPIDPGNYRGLYVLLVDAANGKTNFGFGKENVGALDVTIVVSSSPTPTASPR